MQGAQVQSLVKELGLNLRSLHWKRGVLATGPPGKWAKFLKIVLGFYDI